MAALTGDQNIPMRAPEREVILKVAAATTIYAGALVAVNATGHAVPAADAAGLTVMGRASCMVDNTAGADGDEVIEVLKAVFKYKTDVAGACDLADVGQDVFVLDDNTVVKAAGAPAGIVAGKCDEIDDDGDVWVAIL